MQIKRNVLLTPGPATTTDTVKKAQVVPDICPREQEFCEVMAAVRQKLVAVVHGDERHTAVLFTASGTGGVEVLISSVIPADTKILVINNGAYGERMHQMAARYFSQERVLQYQIPYGSYPVVADVEKIIHEHENISHMCVVHHETTSGMLNPVKELADLAHSHGIELIVDAVSSYAGLPIDIENDGFDYLVSTSNKNIQGIAGIAFIITRKEKIEKLADYPRHNLYLNLYEQYLSFEKTGQMRFTPAVQVVYALNQALDEYFEETAAGRYERYSQSWETLVAGLQKRGFRLLLPLEQQAHLITAVCEPDDENYSFESMHDYLYQRGFCIYPGKIGDIKTFRIANIGAIDKNDISDFLALLDEYIAVHKLRLV